MQYVLMSNVQEIRAGGIRVLRYILMSEEVLDVMLKHCIDLLIMRYLSYSLYSMQLKVSNMYVVQRGLLYVLYIITHAEPL